MSRIKWAAGAVALVGVVVAGGVLDARNDVSAPGGWVSEPQTDRGSAATGADPSRESVLADFGAVTTRAGLGRDAAPQAARDAVFGDAADCAAGWDGFEEVDAAQVTEIVDGLQQRGWQVTARRARPVQGVTLTLGSWELVLLNGTPQGGDRLSLLALRSGPGCDEAFARWDAGASSPV
ncbi:hypothetical protein WKI68_31135 [Streptomyces sp. MS1.HAVA.3]|uniref:Secreted protein n=1 Tax=Streptomyces caledonius TaxID=3134107 RepID=A0ABU8U9M1_9ACTN